MLAIYVGQAFTISGSSPVVAANATVEVRREDTNAIADIYSDEAGTSPILNPSAFADAEGRFQFYAAGLDRGYKITVTKDASNAILRNQAVGKSAQLDFGSPGGSVPSVPDALIALKRGLTSRASNTIHLASDIGTPFIATSSFTQTFEAAATLGNGWHVWWKNDSAGVLTFDPNGGELIDGATTLSISPGESVLIVCDGTAFKSFGRQVTARDAQITRRQTVRFGAVDSSGFANFISAGAGLNFNVDAIPTSLVIDFAAGASDFTATLTADESNQGSLAASNTNYLYATHVSDADVDWSSCLVPPQYGYAFDRTEGALLNFEGADASTTLLDDFGNTWTANGNAQLDTAQSKFGTSSLLLDGAGDTATSTNFSTMGDGSWEVSMWFRINSIAADQYLLALRNGAAVGVVVLIQYNAGAPKLVLRLSSDATSNNIYSPGNGTTTLSTATWYKIRIVFDALAGTYRMYLSNNGAAEVQEHTVSSTARICALTTFEIGSDNGVSYFNGWVDAFRFIRAATKTATETPSASAPTITDYPAHWFSLPEMKMYEVTSASGSAGTNPGMTAVNRVFVGEADTGAATVSAARTYALRGEYESAWATPLPAAGTLTTKSHNLGVYAGHVNVIAENITTDNQWVPGDRIVAGLGSSDASVSRVNTFGSTRNSAYVAVVAGGSAWVAVNRGGGFSAVGIGSNWKYKVVAGRGW